MNLVSFLLLPIATSAFAALPPQPSVCSLCVVPSSQTTTTTTTTTVRCWMARRFQFIEYGRSLDTTTSTTSDLLLSSVPTISCDGRIPGGGVTLELTHWTDNETPQEYYADTSTEMALLLPVDVLPNALVLNNHYDTDGVLSVFSCLQPVLAQQYADVLKAGAEAGDFGEWGSSDLGVKLDAILSAIYTDDDEAVAYQEALEELPLILKDLMETGGKEYMNLWKPTLDHAYECWQALEDREAKIETISMEESEGQLLALLTEPMNMAFCPFSLHRALKETGALGKTTRVLRAMKRFHQDYDLYRYVYEKPGHGWVQRLVDRQPIPPVNVDRMVAGLNAQETKWGNPWKSGGPNGLVGICFANELPETPDEIVKRMIRMEREISS